MKDLKYCVECTIKHLGSTKIKLEEASSSEAGRLREKLREAFIQLNEAEQHLADAPHAPIKDYLIRVRNLRKTVEKEIYKKDPQFKPEYLTETERLLDELNNFAVEQLITKDEEIKGIVEGEAKKMGIKEKFINLLSRPKERYLLKAKLDEGWQELEELDHKITIREAIEQFPEIEEAERARLEKWKGDKFVKVLWTRKPTAAYLSQRESMAAILEESLSLYQTAIKKAVETMGALNTEQLKQTVAAIKEVKNAMKEATEEKGLDLKGLKMEDLLILMLFGGMGSQQPIATQQTQVPVIDLTQIKKRVEEAGLG